MFSHKLGPQAELRLLMMHHAEELFELIDANRQHLYPWFTWIDDTNSPDDTRTFIKHMLSGFADGTDVVVGLWHEGRMAGCIGLHRINKKFGSAEIGYWIGTEYEGKGLITAACRAVLDYAVTELGLNRVEIRMEPDNQRSRAIPRRLGFRYEGTLRQVALARKGLTDHDVYSILRDEWLTSGNSSRNR